MQNEFNTLKPPPLPPVPDMPPFQSGASSPVVGVQMPSLPLPSLPSERVGSDPQDRSRASSGGGGSADTDSERVLLALSGIQSVLDRLEPIIREAMS